MIEKYLQKLYQELFEEKLNLEQEKQRKEVQLKNNVKFLKVLEDSLDEDFESFSPRKVDEESHKKIISLMDEQKIIREEMISLKTKLDDIMARIEELEVVLENVRQNQGYTDVPIKIDENSSEIDNSESEEEEHIEEKIENILLPQFSSIIHKIEMCSKLLDVDSARCKLELEEIQQSVKSVMQKLQKK